ncbi:Inositol polyphosphate 5-phosphatase OCRL-1 [Schistosoma japonicum]|nr:Inositol polyphosphate 5-phosphatase OCRL-1 [Schistosoma japonicum]
MPNLLMFSFQAFSVNIPIYRTNSGTIVSVVQNRSSDQSALFIFSGTKNLASNQSNLTPTLIDLIVVDEEFSCAETDSASRLLVVGKRLTNISTGEESSHSQLKLYVVSNQANDPLDSKENSSDIDSDSETRPNPVFLKSLKNNCQKVIEKNKVQFSIVNFLLEFDSNDDATEFKRKTLQLSSRCQAKLSKLNHTVASADQATYEMGKEALTILNSSSSEQSIWLHKYWKELEQTFTSSSFNTQLSVNDTSELNGNSNKHHPRDLSGSSKSTAYVSSDASSLNETQHITGSSSSIISLNNSNLKVTTVQQNDMSKLLHTNIEDNSNNSNKSKRKSSAKPSSELRHSQSSSMLYSLTETHPLNNNLLSDSPNCQPIPPENKKHLLSSNQINGSVPNSPLPLKMPLAHSCTDLTAYDDQLNKSHEYLEPRIFRARFNQAGNIIQRKLIERMNEYSKVDKIRIFVGTWNVNGRNDGINNIKLDNWLLSPDGQPPADIYVFGFQEMDLSFSVITLNKTSSTGPEERWIQQLEESLGGLLKRPSSHLVWAQKTGSVKSYAAQWSHYTGGGYLRVERVRLAGIMMIVYISARLSTHLRREEISYQVVPTGVFNVMGNKGAVGIRLTIFNSSMCFINCHLAAGEANLDRRNQDFREITRKMLFEFPLNSKNMIQSSERAFISDHDYIFVFGDLNYRITSLDSPTVRKFIFEKDFAAILKYDELLKLMGNRSLFDGFQEPTINFAPTYKFDMNSNVYDSSDKNRVPSYCDRIIWSGDGCEPIAYRSHPGFICSDHKPVSAYFSVDVRQILRSAFQRTYESVLLSIDLTMNLSLPQAELDRQELDFGCVHFHELCSQTLTLTNVGLNDFHFKFLREGVGSFPPWLTVSPSSDTVKKCTSIKLEFQIFVNYKEVYALNSGTNQLSTIVVLQLEDGKDYFISVSGQFIPTCFGLPLVLLLTLGSDPVNKLSVIELQEQIKLTCSENNEYFKTKLCSLAEQKPFHVPKEIFRLVNHINEYITEPDLFRQMGPSSDVSIIRDILDTTPANCPFPETISVHSIASCLLLFLNTLPESVIPQQFHEKCFNSLANFEVAVQALQHLPICNQNLFYYLITFMQRCLTFKEQNGTDIDLLAPCFGEIFFLEPQSVTASATVTAHKGSIAMKQLKRAAFISIFLRHNYLSNSPLISINH